MGVLPGFLALQQSQLQFDDGLELCNLLLHPENILWLPLHNFLNGCLLLTKRLAGSHLVFELLKFIKKKLLITP